jgi:anti-sigma factor RsiW
MHRIIEDGLEDYLVGRNGRDFDVHLAQCPPCRLEVAEFESVSALFRELLTPASLLDASLEPSPGFYARLSSGLEARKASSPWNLFSIDLAFGRRIAFASLMTLALVGGYLVSRESDISPELQGPEAIIAAHDVSTPHDVTVDRDRMMVTLASYER